MQPPAPRAAHSELENELILIVFPLFHAALSLAFLQPLVFAVVLSVVVLSVVVLSVVVQPAYFHICHNTTLNTTNKMESHIIKQNICIYTLH